MMQLLICILFIITSIVVIKHKGLNLNILTLNILYWTFFIVFSFLFTKNYKWGNGSLYILVFIVFYYLGYSILNLSVKKKSATSRECSGLILNQKMGMFILLFVVIWAFIKPMSTIYDYGERIDVLFSFSRLVELNQKIAVDRYTNNSAMMSSGIFSSITLIIFYLGPLIGGYLFFHFNTKVKKSFAFFPFLPILLNLAIDNGKIAIIYGSFLFLSSYVTTYLFEKGRQFPIPIKKFGIVFFLIILLLYLSLVIRSGDLSLQSILNTFDKFNIYAFGSVKSFDNWITRYRVTDLITHGKYTFYFIFDILGVTREQGVYGFIDGSESNVFTSFRGLIMDFTLLGSFIWAFVFGVISYIAYTAVSKKSRKTYTRVVLVFCYYTILTSFLISSLTYSSVIAAFILFYMFLLVMEKRVVLK